MAPDGQNIGRVFVDVDIESEASLRGKVDAVFEKPFDVKLSVSKSSLSGLRGQINAALAKPFKIRIEVDKRGVATIARDVTRVQQSITAAEAKERARRETNRQRFYDSQRLITLRGENEIAKIQSNAASKATQRAIDEDARLTRARVQAQLRDQVNEANHQRILERMQLRGQRSRTSAITNELDRAFGALSSFNARSAQILTASTLAFTAWSAAVVAATAAVGVAATKQFAQVETAALRAGAVLANDQFQQHLQSGSKSFFDFAAAARASSKEVIAASNAVAKTTLFNPREVAEGAKALAQAGLNQTDTLQQLGTVANFAQNEELDLYEATRLLTTGATASGLAMTKLTDISDKFTFVAQATSSEADEVAEAFGNRAAGAFRAFGQSVEETLLGVELFAKTGLRGRTAGEQLGIGIRFVNQAFAKNRSAWKDYGVSVEDASGRSRKFFDVLLDLTKLQDQLTKKFGAAEAQRIFTKELGLTERSAAGFRQLQPVLRQFTKDQLDQQRKLISESAGATERTASVVTNGLEVQFQAFVENIAATSQAFGATIEKSLISLFDAFNTRLGQSEKFVKAWGAAVSARLNDLRVFVESPAFANGMKTLVESIRVTLGGVGDALKAFGDAASGAGKSRTAFEGFANGVLAFSKAAAATLPVVASAIGHIVGFIADHPDVATTFAKLSIASIALAGAYKLLVRPLLIVTDKLLALNAVSKTLEISKLAFAVGGLRAVPAILGRIVPGLALVYAGFETLVGFVRGFVSEFRVSMGEGSEFRASLRNLKPVFEAISTAVGHLSAQFQSFGAMLGGEFAQALVSAINLLSDLKDAFTFDLNVKNAAAHLGDFARSAAHLTAVLSGAGNLYDRFADSIKRASSDASDGSINFAALASGVDKVTSSLSAMIVAQEQSAKTERGIDRAREATSLRLQAASKGVSDARLRVKQIDQEIAAARMATGGDQQHLSTVERLRDLSQEAADAVSKLSKAQLSAQGNDVAARVQKLGNGYRLTRREIALLEANMPRFDAALERQRNLVQKLDAAMNALRNTQLKGTKAFSDQAFALDQQMKQLQLQRINLVIGGASEEDSAVATLDKQIQDLQNRSEQLNLQESLQLDPLRRKLDETFNPVKELAFGDIVGQFKQLSAQQADQNAKLAQQESIQKTLNLSLDSAKKFYDGIDGAARRAAEAQDKAAESTGRVARNISELRSQRQAALADLRKATLSEETAKQDALRLPAAIARSAANATKVGLGFLSGLRNTFYQRILPFSHVAKKQVEDNIKPDLIPNGFQTMLGFEDGMKSKMGDKSSMAPGTIAFYLNKTVPNLIRQLKGPVAYDATILVPAGEAIMTGLDRGLRSGFGTVESFLRNVAPSMSEFVPESLFSNRTAEFMVDVAMGKKPDADKFFANLMPEAVSLAGGLFDPSLMFMHKTASLLDTTKMASSLAKSFALSVTALKYNHNKFTSSGNISDHFYGTAADLSNGSSPTPQMDALFAALKPLVGKVIKQIIYKHQSVRSDSGVGYYPGSDHFNHVHVAWLMDKKFDLLSSNIGQALFAKIPGASATVSQALSQAASRYNIPLALLAAVAKQESGFNPRAVSGDGGYGLMQLTSQFLKDKAGSNILDPFVNADVGAYYLKTLLNRFGGNFFKALAGYNGGPGAGEHPFAQVIKYANSVLSIFRDFSKSFGGFRERGGPVSYNRPYIVGERGPELFVPSRSGQIVNNRDTMAMMNQPGRSVTYNPVYQIYTNATDPRAVAAHIDARTRHRVGMVNLQ